MRAKEASEDLTGESILRQCEQAGWIKPCQRRKKFTLYRRRDVQAVAERLLYGEYPETGP
jgi:hypothetical protein